MEGCLGSGVDSGADGCVPGRGGENRSTYIFSSVSISLSGELRPLLLQPVQNSPQHFEEMSDCVLFKKSIWSLSPVPGTSPRTTCRGPADGPLLAPALC